MSNKVVLIDCGANIGGSVNYFRNQFKDREMFTYAFECDPLNVKILNKVFEGDKNIQIFNKGVWIEDTKMDMLLERWWGYKNGSVHCGAQTSSTLIKGKKNTPRYSVDSSCKFEVKLIDLEKWLLNNLSENDHNILKIDVEGAEYKIFPKLLKNDKLVSIIDEWKVELTSAGRFVGDDINHETYRNLETTAKSVLGDKFINWTQDIEEWNNEIKDKILKEKTGKNFHEFCIEDPTYHSGNEYKI